MVADRLTHIEPLCCIHSHQTRSMQLDVRIGHHSLDHLVFGHPCTV